MTIKCVIFDVDGTLLDNTKSIIKIFQDLLIKYLGPNRGMTTEEVLGLWGPPGDVIFKKVYPASIVDSAWAEFLELYRQNHPKTGFFTADQLFNLRNSVEHLGIFTGKGRQTNAITLEILDLSNAFDIIFTGNDVINSKPDPEALYKILELLKLNGEEVLFIGDSHLDIIAGKAAGTLTAGALWGAVEAEKLINAKPDFLFNTPAEFLEFIEEKK